MHIILGGTGHVGGAVARHLLDRGEVVQVVTHDATKGEDLARRGARLAVVDVMDTEKLRDIFRGGKRAFLLNPPAAPTTDTDRRELETGRSVIAALEGSGLEKVVAQSTYGARPGERCGDLTTLYAFEEGLRAQAVPATIMRSAYLMSNWDAQREALRKTGMLSTFFPADFELPMVAPDDLGAAGAELMLQPPNARQIHYVEGPRRYSSADVASAYTSALGRLIKVETTPRDRWVDAYRALGFSEAAAASYACMTGATLDGAFPSPDAVDRRGTSLEAYAIEISAMAPVGS